MPSRWAADRLPVVNRTTTQARASKGSRAPLLLCAALTAIASPTFADAPSLIVASALRQGEPGVAWLVSRPDSGGTAIAGGGSTLAVEFADGRLGRPAIGFAPSAGAAEGRSRLGGSVWGAGPSAVEPRPTAIAFVFAVPVDAAVGKALVSAFGPDGKKVAEVRASVAGRAFPREDIRLDTALTGIRIDPDPRKAEQAARYQALLARANPVADYLDGGLSMPVRTRRITSLFGTRRRYLYADGGSDRSTHWGTDFGCPTGTPVFASAPGRIAMAEDRIVTGKTVVIEHAPSVYTIYMHLDSVSVKEGDAVGREREIGKVGATGLATGPHLHWELRIAGEACDPGSFAGLDKIPSIHTIPYAIEGR